MSDIAESLRVIGLISGTSADGVDGALVEITGHGDDLQVHLVAAHGQPYPASLRRDILRLCQGDPIPLPELAAIDDAIARTFAQTATTLMAAHSGVDLIASHGQTVFHRPVGAEGDLAYSLQLGRGAVIADHTGCPTVSNFRQADISVGGEGAPLVPRVDRCLLSHPHYHRCVQNIGGIGNVTYLPPRSPSPGKVMGWDTGPGNSLLDIAVHTLSGGNQTYDQDGMWAAQGQANLSLVEQWLSHPFFDQPPPKSTGRELFGWQFYQHCAADAQAHQCSAADLLASLSEFTARSIALAYRWLPTSPDQVLLCGGGCHNRDLVSRLVRHLNPVPVLTTDAVGLSADYKEAIAFAVLGYWRYHQQAGNLPEATGARREVPLGELALP